MESKSKLYSRRILPIVFIISVIMMTIYEAIKEWIFKGALTPWESHTITIIVTSIIATLAAAVMRSWVLKLYQKEKELAVKEQSIASFEMAVSAVNHIVNNIVNYLQVIRIEVEQIGRVSEETLDLLEKSMEEAEQQVKELNQITTPLDPKSYEKIYPRKKN